MATAATDIKYEAVIGLEVHAQMRTETKIFCGCPTAFGSEPNSQTCPICIGMPGVLPVLNRIALEFAIRSGLATSCTIAPYSRFARKNYFYPDLPKGYQISQYEQPICEHGRLDIMTGGRTKSIGITRIHMEEDAGKNIHDGGGPYSLVDLNRTGIPLMEIVSEPDMRTPQEAAEYMRTLRSLLRWIGVCDGNMEEGSLRCDANVSVRPEGQAALGVKVEIKNINSFKFVEKAIEYEIRRQIKTINKGGEIAQETRLWDTNANVTVSMRSKEMAHDYRYFPDPDLVPITTSPEQIEAIRGSLPELPSAKFARYTGDMGLSSDDASFLTSERTMADWFEAAVNAGGQPKAVSNWMMGELMRLLNEDGITIEQCKLTANNLAELLILIASGKISNNQAKVLFKERYRVFQISETIGNGNVTLKPVEAGGTLISLEDRAKELGLVQVSDEGAIERMVDEVLAANPSEVERFRAGDEKLMGFFVGQLMKLAKGKANPRTANELLSRKLKG